MWVFSINDFTRVMLRAHDYPIINTLCPQAELKLYLALSLFAITYVSIPANDMIIYLVRPFGLVD